MSIQQYQPWLSFASISVAYDSLPRGIQAGTETWFDGKKYRLFYNYGSATIVAGNAFTFSPTSNNHYVTLSAIAAGGSPCAGFDSGVTVGVGQYFFGITKGIVYNAVNSSDILTSATAVSGYRYVYNNSGSFYPQSNPTSCAAATTQCPALVGQSATANGKTVSGYFSAFGA